MMTVMVIDDDNDDDGDDSCDESRPCCEGQQAPQADQKQQTLYQGSPEKNFGHVYQDDDQYHIDH